MRYHETHEGRGLLYIKVTEAEAEELWRLAHHHMPDDDKDLAEAIIQALDVGLGHPLGHKYREPPYPLMKDYRAAGQVVESEAERKEKSVVELRPSGRQFKPFGGETPNEG